jgi:hypothetical protein
METTPSPTVAAQQAAIAQVRARYERGELSFEALHRALDAIVLARTPDECQAILRALQTSQSTPLAALDPPTAPPAPTAGQGYRRIGAFLGQTKKMRRAWRLAPFTEAVAYLGEVKLDLGVAQMPPVARLRVKAILGSATVYVPRGMRVRVHSRVLLGEANALGEHTSGILTASHEEHVPTEGLPTAEVEIETFVLMGNVQIVLTDGPVLSIGDMVRDAVRAVADGFRRGWVAESTSAARRPAPRPLDAGRPR